MAEFVLRDPAGGSALRDGDTLRGFAGADTHVILRGPLGVELLESAAVAFVEDSANDASLEDSATVVDLFVV